jgi:uncharacterized tellurite resistance protein B-like protein
MHVSLLRWFGLTGDDDAPEVDSLAAIERALENLEPGQARFLAGFAYILSRVAGADHEITPEESAIMEELVAERGNLPAAQAALVVQIARTQTQRHRGTEDFIVTRAFAGIASREQKLALLDCLFAVSSSDQSIRTIEDNEIRRIASELKVEHQDFINARSAHMHHLEVLKARGRHSP